MFQRNDLTTRLLTPYLTPGLSVLDFGCGAGEVSQIAARLVTETGQVLGIDTNQAVIEHAKTQAQTAQLKQLRFEATRLEDLINQKHQFDAITIRRVLMYLENPAATLKDLSSLLKPGGYLIIQESDAQGTAANHHLPLHAKVQHWPWQTVQKEGGNIHIGSQLYGLIKAQDLHIENLVSETLLQTIETGSDLYWLISVMKERMLKHHVVSSTELHSPTLEQDLQTELANATTPFVRDVSFGIVAKKI